MSLLSTTSSAPIMARSNRREVRNPIFSLPAAARLQQLSPEARTILCELLEEIVADARMRAQRSWLQNKGPMAAYWKAVGAYCEHIRRVIRRGAPQIRPVRV